MTELDDDGLMIARGRYSTIYQQHKIAKKALVEHGDKLIAQIVRLNGKAQPRHGEIAEGLLALVLDARETLSKMEECAYRIEDLSKQCAELQSIAWG